MSEKRRPWAMRGRERDIAAAVAAAPSLRKAAQRLGCHVSTVSRLVKAKRVPGRPGPKRAPTPAAPPADPGSFSEWCHTVFNLNEGERELVGLAQLARDVAHDLTVPAAVRLQAAGRFAALLKQLELPTEEQHGDIEEPGRWPRPVIA
jgi:hypothetical protein